MMNRRSFLAGAASLAPVPIALKAEASEPLGDLLWASFDGKGRTLGRAVVLRDVSFEVVKTLLKSNPRPDDRGAWEWWHTDHRERLLAGRDFQ